METAIEVVGLPVKCRKCGEKGFVKPRSDYGGWYKSKLFRLKRAKWYCPEHYEIGRKVDNHFYDNYLTPHPYTKTELEVIEETQDELYKLLD